MTHHTESRYASNVSGTAAMAAGTFGSCKAGALLLTRRSLETAARQEDLNKNDVIKVC
ncbi:MAG: hypothetical protein LBK94_08320 [Prevotellaceae bacterium]|nr:hypothetical protein [Prevotellaceae bacterium]